MPLFKQIGSRSLSHLLEDSVVNDLDSGLSSVLSKDLQNSMKQLGYILQNLFSWQGIN